MEEIRCIKANIVLSPISRSDVVSLQELSRSAASVLSHITINTGSLFQNIQVKGKAIYYSKDYIPRHGQPLPGRFRIL